MRYISVTWQRIRDLYAGRYDPESLRVLAYSYWEFLLAVVCISIIGIAVFGFYIFSGVIHNLNAPFRARSATPDATLNRAQLDETLNAFIAREAAFNAAKSAPPSATDPSK